MNISNTDIKSIFQRWQRLEESKADVQQDLKELFIEAKGNGFDAKELRRAFRSYQNLLDNPDQEAESNAVFDLYLDTLRGFDQTGTDYATRADAHEGE